MMVLLAFAAGVAAGVAATVVTLALWAVAAGAEDDPQPR